ncbi:MAG TPA: transketolase [Thermoanaerobaculia bacterium]
MAEQVKQDVDQLAINTIRFLSVDMVEKAKSGHPGAPMGQAPLAYLLWTRHMRHNPDNPDWPNRDRFVLSCGHASALLYSLLHLGGYGLPMEDVQRFRQWGSKTPGHPEHELTRGVETTTGPLGQGIANAVGMAIAEKMGANHFNREGFPLIDHRIWVIASDGDMMEGVSHEACSLAGHLKLDRLKVFYDANEISIDGPTSLSFSEDVGKRFEAYGWHVLRVDDGNDLEALEAAIQAADAQRDRPTLVVVRTIIGYGSPGRQGTAKAHGEPLGGDEVVAAKKNLGWPLEPTFLVPDEARAPFEEARQRGRKQEEEWNDLLRRYREAHPDLGADLETRLANRLPEGWDADIPSFSPDDKPIATRAASGKVLNGIAPRLGMLVGGSADLTPSNNTQIQGRGDFSAAQAEGLYLRFGVREHGMGSIMNGMALSRLWIPYGGTFLIFSDYMRPPVRLAALMRLQTIYVYTHDSIFLGEDGPTHQPIGQLASLRAIPNLTVLRPADGNETAEAWRVAILHRHGPVALALTRQNLPILAETARKAREGVAKGAYVLVDSEGDPDVILIATGSEVPLAVESAKQLGERGIKARVVSMPSWELFDEQPQEYRDSVLPPSMRKRLAIEAAAPFGWHKYVGTEGEVHAIERFGASAPHQDLAREFGFTPEKVVERVEGLLGRY